MWSQAEEVMQNLLNASGLSEWGVVEIPQETKI